LSPVRAYFSLDIVFAAGLLTAVLLALAWGQIRHEEEKDRVALTRLRMNGVVQELRSRLDAKIPRGDASKDGWGRPLFFDDTLRTVHSLGADGLPGGDGYNADIRLNVDSNSNSNGETR